jgi:hypothetical protein
VKEAGVSWGTVLCSETQLWTSLVISSFSFACPHEL